MSHFKEKLLKKSNFSSPRRAPSLPTLSSSKQSSEKENSIQKLNLISQAQALSTSTPNEISMSTLPAFFKPLQKPRSKLNRPLEDTKINLKNKLFSENHLPRKRLSPDYINDDDFAQIFVPLHCFLQMFHVTWLQFNNFRSYQTSPMFQLYRVLSNEPKQLLVEAFDW